MSAHPSSLPRRVRTTLALVLSLLLGTLGVGLALAPEAHAATGAVPCSTGGTSRHGEPNVDTTISTTPATPATPTTPPPTATVSISC